tara:strand:+ start:320 stop:1315 length:996 start_codon:yes stop_codon:yes gene_type:complete
MTKFRKLPSENSCPKVDWFKDLELPTGRTFVCTGREVRALDHIERENNDGQVINIARETGTSKENYLAIANNIKVNGVLLDAQPPFISEDGVLKDGFTRIESLGSLGITHWVFNIVEPKEGFTWNDVNDEIGLGANNHPPSKPATPGDFVKSLARWVSRQDKTPTSGECQDWINDIPHSFTPGTVAKIAEKVLKSNAAKASMESLEAPDVIRRTKELNGDCFTNRVKIIPVNISGNKTYFKRVVCDRVEYLANPKISETYMVGYTKDIPADEVEEVRQDGLEYTEKINAWFENAFQLRMKRGASFKFLDIDAFVPQVIGEETELIKVKKRG